MNCDWQIQPVFKLPVSWIQFGDLFFKDSICGFILKLCYSKMLHLYRFVGICPRILQPYQLVYQLTQGIVTWWQHALKLFSMTARNGLLVQKMTPDWSWGLVDVTNGSQCKQRNPALPTHKEIKLEQKWAGNTVLDINSHALAIPHLTQESML